MSASTTGPQRGEESAAWSVMGRLIAGPLLYGGLGYLLDRWIGTYPLFLAVGVVTGFAAAIYLVVATSGPPSSDDHRDPRETDSGA